MENVKQRALLVKMAEALLTNKIEHYKRKALDVSKECIVLKEKAYDSSILLPEGVSEDVELIFSKLDEINSKAVEHCVKKITELEGKLEIVNEFKNSKELNSVGYKKYNELISYINNSESNLL